MIDTAPSGLYDDSFWASEPTGTLTALLQHITEKYIARTIVLLGATNLNMPVAITGLRASAGAALARNPEILSRLPLSLLGDAVNHYAAKEEAAARAMLEKAILALDHPRALREICEAPDTPHALAKANHECPAIVTAARNPNRVRRLELYGVFDATRGYVVSIEANAEFTELTLDFCATDGTAFSLVLNESSTDVAEVLADPWPLARMRAGNWPLLEDVATGDAELVELLRAINNTDNRMCELYGL